MITNALDIKIEEKQKELTKTCHEIIRLQELAEDQTRELLQLQAERDENSGLKTKVLIGGADAND